MTLLSVLLFLLSVSQSASFQSDPPHKCDACDDWNKPREPFRIYGNTYYVGTDGLSAILVTGNAGHVLLDGGLEQSAALIDANIRKLGFKLQDVKLIVNSHGHYDHAGGINALQRASGATVAASPSSASALQRGENTPDDPQFGFGKAENGFPAVKDVKVIKDNEVLRVGNIAITANFTPGHTPGSTAWTWQSCEGAACLNMVYADSLTAVSAPGFRYTDEPDRVNLFRRSITRVAELPCDIVVSTHPSATGLDAKVKKRASLKGADTDPFVDQGCRALAAAGLKSLEARIAEEKEVTATEGAEIADRLGARLVVIVAALALSVACSGPLELANIQVGRALNQDRSISSITTLFKPNETVYVSVQTKAAGKGTVSVRWKFGSQLIDEPSKPVSYDGPASTEFHLQNSGGFPPGDYSVDVLIDGVQVGTRAFKVDRYYE